jgi:cytochrome c-type biogenesis protein CcmH
MNLRLLLSILIIAGLLTAATSAKAELADADPPTDDEVNAIAKKLYCPVCPNTPLDVCETKACQDWRAQIRDQLASGWTEDQIIEYFVEQYGERVLAEPRMSGFTAIVWLSPLVAVVLGLLILRRLLNRWKVPHCVDLEEGDPSAEVPSAVLARIEAELEDLR